MIRLALALIPFAFLIAMVLTAMLIRHGHRRRLYDSEGVAGQVKAAPRKVPNTGGIAVFVAIAAPILLQIWIFSGIDSRPDADWRTDLSLLPADTHEHVAGIQAQTPLAWLVLACMLLLHLLGLIDDRRPLGPFVKLVVMSLPAFGIPLITTWSPHLSDTRLLTLLDAHVGGPWLSIVLTGVWFLVVINALNFIDNMDGLSSGVALVASTCFLLAAIMQEQWFIAACLSLVIGACAGFLVFNFPWRQSAGGARIFLGDGGSLVLGFFLAFLTVRTTYVPTLHTTLGVAPLTGSEWYAVFMPLCVLAVPIYDFVSVCLIRIRNGKSPFVGDLNHLSHRLVRRGLSRRAAVLVIYGATAITGMSGVILSRASGLVALLVGAQVVLILVVLGLFEFASDKARTPETNHA